MMSYDEQVRMFKDTITIGPKQTSELVELLKEKIEVAEIALTDLPGNTMQNAYFNASHCILNDDLRLKPADMSFVAYRVIPSEKSKPYESQDDAFTYVIFERRTGYVLSNSDRLFLELEFARGVSQKEFDTEGDQFRSLIAHIAICYCEEHGIED